MIKYWTSLSLLLLTLPAHATPHALQAPRKTASAATSLPSLRISDASISGVSSGAFMAVQMATAFSSDFTGVGSVAGGIYWCAEGNSQRAQSTCMSGPKNIIPLTQVKKAKDLAAAGTIDSLENVAKQKVYVFASSKDTVIYPANGDKMLEFYKELGVSQSAIRFETSIQAGHGFPTLEHGNACHLGMPPWINKCGFDAAGEMLRHFYGELNPKVKMVPGNLKKFSQAPFGNEKTPLYKEGWVYVPTACANGKGCRLHVALHGCLMNPDFIQDKFVTLAGYNEWAESNRIVVLYPQSAKLAPQNPYACWDWFGFTGQNYVEKSGAQMAALKKMMETVGAR
jgi:poly(3-hydroxybutyrate) depolymerase